MRRQDGFVGFFVDSFTSYIDPRPEDTASFSSSRNSSNAGRSLSNSDRLCLLIFIFAFIFIGVVSPILCFGSLFIKLNFEGLWYFWFITFSEIAYLAWFILRKKAIKQHKHIYTKNTMDVLRMSITHDVSAAS
ncbi:MAG: hypothetical protein CVU91_04855 [Firmicutes bacterium HGW-Firmicutes-16]|nr:MAG: hypothetical protein CVU91_04855 [Firmicutes bacterium HGW-Firmicutes-16]